MKAKNDWHLLTDSEALEKLSADMYKGLDEHEIGKRRRIYGRNLLWSVGNGYTSQGMFASVFDIATLLLVISAVCSAMFERKGEAGLITAILILGAAVRAVTFIRAERILEDTARAKIPSVSVIRSGRVKMISSSEVVPGDIVFLEAGDKVPCDGRVLANGSVTVSEKGITENKTPLKKFNTAIKLADGSHDVPCEFRSNMLFAGSTVISGSVRMLAVATGEETLVYMKHGGIELECGDIPEIEKLRDRSRTVSLVMLGCVMLLTMLAMLVGSQKNLPSVFLSSMSMATAAMSEFLTVIGYIIFSIAVRDCRDTSFERKTRSKKGSSSIIRRPERLGKIGNVKTAVFCTSSVFKSGEAVIAACRTSNGYTDGEKIRENDGLERLLGYAQAASLSVSNGISVGETGEKSLTSPEKLTHLAMDSYVKLVGKGVKNSCSIADHRGHEAEGSMGMETSLVLEDNELYALSCGSIDDVMRCCTTIETENGTVELDTETRRKIFRECAGFEISGGRVLAVARRVSQFPSLIRLPVLTQYMTFVGYFAIAEKEEDNARENIAYIKEKGISPVVFSRTPQADLYYLRRIGLFDRSVKVLEYGRAEQAKKSNGAIISFEGLSDREYAEAAVGVMKKLGGEATLAVGKSVWNSGVLAQSEFGITVAQSSMRNVPETLARNSDAVVHPCVSFHSSSSGDISGGLDGVVRVLKTSERACGNITAAKFYLTAAQTSRLVIMTVAVCFGLFELSPVFVLIWGLLADFAAVLAVAFGNYSGSENAKILESTKVSIGFGAVWGAVLSALAVVASVVFSSSDLGVALLAGSALLSSVAVTEIIMKPKITASAYNNADLMFSGASVLFALLLMLTEAGGKICGGCNVGVKALLALIPSVLFVAAYFAVKAMRKKKAKNNDNTEKSDKG